MKKIYRIILIIEVLLLVVFAIGYFVFEEKAIIDNNADSEGCVIIPQVQIGGVASANDDNKTFIGKKEDLNS